MYSLNIIYRICVLCVLITKSEMSWAKINDALYIRLKLLYVVIRYTSYILLILVNDENIGCVFYFSYTLCFLGNADHYLVIEYSVPYKKSNPLTNLKRQIKLLGISLCDIWIVCDLINATN